MYFVEKVQAQGERQRKLPVPKKFWEHFPLDSMVKITILETEIFIVDRVQHQGKLQRRIPIPQKFWPEFPVGAIVKVECIKR